MIFSSYSFILIFLPLTLLVFHILRNYFSGKKALIFLIFSSLLFYGLWKPIYLFLLLFSIGSNFLLLSLLNKNKKKKFLIIGIIINLVILFYFKYRYFIIENLSLLIDNDLEIKKIIIPLGISFFTFQQIALLIDTYQNKTKCKTLLEFTFFVSFFPQLIAGPIVLFEEIRQQLNSVIKKNNFDLKNLNIGFSIFTIGLFKKVSIGDSLGIFVDKGYSIVNELTFIEAWLLSIGYFFQIYFDFSGYSDMALGLGLMFGFVLPVNFNNPYKATSMIDYWQRWHITMTRFFMTYIYTPLVFIFTRKFENLFGNNYLFFSVSISILITFFCSGLWHGSHWKFVMFGLVNAIGLIINHFWRQKDYSFNKFLGWFLTMLTVLISLIYFRADNISEANFLLHIMFSFEHSVLPQFLYKMSNFFNYEIAYLSFLTSGQYSLNYILLIFFSIFTTIFLPDYANKVKKLKINWKFSLFISSIFILSISILDRPQTFIYFQF